MCAQSRLAPSRALDTAVLFLVFNRLDTTMLVFREIQKARPPRLYIACDGPRDCQPTERNTVNEIRTYLLNNVDWPCEVKTLFSEVNLGCAMACTGAINWFFTHEEMGIILEDDCLPDISFFQFCEDMLRKYENDTRIWHVTGMNPIPNCIESNKYTYTKDCGIWGWATWRRAWKHYDVNMRKWGEDEIRSAVLSYYPREQKAYAKNIFNGIYNKALRNEVDGWDYQWFFTIASQSGLSVTPEANLVSNIGFGHPEAVHTTDPYHVLVTLPRGKMIFPTQSNTYVIANVDLDHAIFRIHNPNLLFRARRKAMRILRKLKWA